jgi:predicted metal-dependent hydrolase
MEFAYLGQRLTLRLDTPCDAATLVADVLHLPLPPGAVARQIQDAVEAWLRQEARRVIVYVLERTAHCFGCPVPEWSFSFSALADWAQQHDDGSLRFNWHLIEQSPAFIEQIVAAALESTCGVGVTADLWSQGET